MKNVFKFSSRYDSARGLMQRLCLLCKHPIKYTIPNITKAAIPIVGYAAFAIYSHSFFHLVSTR